jgi:hypothetical protein
VQGREAESISVLAPVRAKRRSRAPSKWIAGADRRHDCTRDQRADAGYRHQSLATFVLTGQRHDLAGEMLDAIIQPAPVSGKVLDDARLD